MEHGQSIARRLGLTVAAETFNPVIVDFYEQVGYLPEAILNYLLLLGWSLDDKTEDFTREEMLRHFSLERVNKAPASFDPEKLVAFQARAMQRVPIKQKVAKVVPFLQKAGLVASPPPCDTGPFVTQLVEAAAIGSKWPATCSTTTSSLSPTMHSNTTRRRSRSGSPSRRGRSSCWPSSATRLPSVEPFTAARLETWMHEWVAAEGIKIGDIVHAVRVAVTGKAVGFGLFDTLAILGRERCLARIDRALALSRRDKPAG